MQNRALFQPCASGKLLHRRGLVYNDVFSKLNKNFLSLRVLYYAMQPNVHTASMIKQGKSPLETQEAAIKSPVPD